MADKTTDAKPTPPPGLPWGWVPLKDVWHVLGIGEKHFYTRIRPMIPDHCIRDVAGNRKAVYGRAVLAAWFEHKTGHTQMMLPPPPDHYLSDAELREFDE